METRTVKERLLDDLRTAPRTKDELLSEFRDDRQARGAASVLAYLVKTDQAEIVDGRYRLTGRAPQKIARALTSTLRTEPTIEAPVAPPEPELQWALWHDGDLLIRRGEVNLVLTPNERKLIGDWLSKVAA